MRVVTLLKLHLWREWREQRFVLAVLAAILALVTVATTALASTRTFEDSAFVGYWSALALIAFLFVNGGEYLFADDARRVRFLDRIPGGLRAAYVAKYVAFLASAAAMLALGVALANVGTLVRTGALATEGTAGVFGSDASALLVVVLAAAACVPIVSPWVARPSLAAPLAGVVLVLLAWTVDTVLEDTGYRPSDTEWRVALALFALASPLCAYTSFAHGRRHGRDARAASAIGLATLGALVLPGAAWGVSRYYAVTGSLDPYADGFSITDVAVCGDGRHVLVEVEQRLASMGDDSPTFALVVDLADGSYVTRGGAGAAIVRVHPSIDHAVRYGPWTDVVVDAQWDEVGIVEADGSLSSFPEERFGIDSIGGVRAGFGLRQHVERLDAQRYYDPSRGEVFSSTDLFDEATDFAATSVLIRPGEWVVPRYDGDVIEWHALDPATRTTRRLDWPTSSASARRPNGSHWPIFFVQTLLPDARVLLQNVDGGPLLATVDGAEGAAPVRFPASDVVTPAGVLLMGYGARDYLAFEPDELAVFRDEVAYYVLRGERLELLFPNDGEREVLATLEDETLLVLRGGSQLVRHDPRDGSEVVLFPVEEAKR